MADYIPRLPAVSTNTRVLTYYEAVEAVLDRWGRKNTGRDARMARRAVLEGYDELPRRSEWLWYRRRMRLPIEAAQTSSTVTYDHTGGSNEREVTIAAGTWPSNVAYGILEVSDKYYDVDERISDTVITLRSDSNPGADVAAGTSYRWFREAYPVPPDFWKGRSPIDSERGEYSSEMFCADMDDVVARNRSSSSQTSSSVYYYAYGADRRVAGIQVYTAPVLSGARTLEMAYQSFGRPLEVYCEKQGTASVTSGSAAVTGSGTAFTSSMVGSVMWFSGDDRTPTPQAGSLDDIINPPAMVRFIKSVESTTALTLDATADTTVSGKKYIISDPVDIEPKVMGNAFYSLVEMHFARNEVSHDRSILRDMQEWAEREIRFSTEADYRNASVTPSVIWGGVNWTMPYMTTLALA